MIKIIAVSQPMQYQDLQIFVEYKDNIWLLTKPYDLDKLNSAFVPGNSIEECVALLNRSMDEPCFASLSTDNIRFVDDNLKAQIVSVLMKNKRIINNRLEDLQEQA